MTKHGAPAVHRDNTFVQVNRQSTKVSQDDTLVIGKKFQVRQNTDTATTCEGMMPRQQIPMLTS